MLTTHDSFRPRKSDNRMVHVWGVPLIACTLACSTMQPPSARDARLTQDPVAKGAAVSQLELQQSVQRFTGEFFERVTQSVLDMEAAKPLEQAQHDASLRRLLNYGSSALDIASGPNPEINVLDMLVFVSLSRQTLESYWIPQVFGAQGQPLLEAFTASEKKVWGISDTIMSATQQHDLRELIAHWQSRHPSQTRVEWVRFQDFASRAAEVAEERASVARGLLGGVRVAAQTADQALLLTERAMFLAHRMPFMLRLQARIGVQETLDDSLGKLASLQSLMESATQLTPLLRDASTLSINTEGAVREGRLLLRDLDPLLRSLKIIQKNAGSAEEPSTVDVAEVHRVLAASNQLADSSLSILQQLRGASGADANLGPTIDRTLRRWLMYLVLAGAAWAAFFWGGYYLAKRAVAPAATTQRETNRDSRHSV